MFIFVQVDTLQVESTYWLCHRVNTMHSNWSSNTGYHINKGAVMQCLFTVSHTKNHFFCGKIFISYIYTHTLTINVLSMIPSFLWILYLRYIIHQTYHVYCWPWCCLDYITNLFYLINIKYGNFINISNTCFFYTLRLFTTSVGVWWYCHLNLW